MTDLAWAGARPLSNKAKTGIAEIMEAFAGVPFEGSHDDDGGAILAFSAPNGRAVTYVIPPSGGRSFVVAEEQHGVYSCGKVVEHGAHRDLRAWLHGGRGFGAGVEWAPTTRDGVLDEVLDALGERLAMASTVHGYGLAEAITTVEKMKRPIVKPSPLAVAVKSGVVGVMSPMEDPASPEALRRSFGAMRDTLTAVLPDGRSKEIALTSLDTAMLFALEAVRWPTSNG